MSLMMVHMLGRYALFLERFRGRNDLAERFYRRAVAVAPDHLPSRGRFALFLETVRQDYDGAEEQYRQAIALAPNDPVLLGNYADFLEHARGDMEGAECFYRRALEVAPLHPNNLTNYATFLMEVSGEYDRAESLYQKALEIAPEHRNGLFKYAIFLTDIRGQYAEAADLYRRGLVVAPDNPAMLANFAGVLLLQGRETEGLAALEQALRHKSLQAPSADALECWFYGLIYGAPDGYPFALQAVRRLLEAGIRSPGFNLEPHVEQAREREHPWAEWIALLAPVVIREAPIEVLAEWTEWQAASVGTVH